MFVQKSAHQDDSCDLMDVYRIHGFVRFSTHAFQLLLVDVYQPSGEAPWMLGPCPKVHRPLSSVTL